MSTNNVRAKITSWGVVKQHLFYREDLRPFQKYLEDAAKIASREAKVKMPLDVLGLRRGWVNNEKQAVIKFGKVKIACNMRVVPHGLPAGTWTYMRLSARIGLFPANILPSVEGGSPCSVIELKNEGADCPPSTHHLGRAFWLALANAHVSYDSQQLGLATVS